MSTREDELRRPNGASGRSAESAETGSDGRLWVEQAGVRRPFMRGIMIHSLMARGVPFDEANRTANIVRDRLRPQGVVAKVDIVHVLHELLDPALFDGEHLSAQGVEVIVEGDGKSAPFSKGVLSQSLLAAAIDPDDAFEVARDIETELRQRAVRSIERSELRRLAFHTVTRRVGPKSGERYLVWRHYEEPERPVILLLGGAAGVGKTSLALEVAHRLGIGRVLSTDSIRQIMRLMLSEELAPAIHGSSYDAHQNFAAGALGSDPVVEAFRAQATTVSVGVKASIERAIDENTHLVIDGVSLFPGSLDLDAYVDRADVIFLVVATLDPGAFPARFAARETTGGGIRPAHRYVQNLDAILHIQDAILDAAERLDVPIVDNESFDRAVLLVIRHLTEALRERPGFDPQGMI
ncbi:MAG: ATP cone domain-containing protein [Myxococcota bacterium]